MPTIGPKKWLRFLLFATAAFCSEISPRALAESTPTPAQHSIQPEAWQTRRLQRLKVLKEGLVPNAAIASSKALEQMLTDFETHPFAQTPIENMDLLGLFYAPKEGIAKALPLIVMNAALGWYDALRFGSPSGQAEIVNNEMFFKRVLVLSGKQRTNEYLEFAKAHPEEIQAAVVQGLAFAERNKDSENYDHRWPTAYGLEQQICSLGGKCSPR